MLPIRTSTVVLGLLLLISAGGQSTAWAQSESSPIVTDGPGGQFELVDDSSLASTDLPEYGSLLEPGADAGAWVRSWRNGDDSIEVFAFRAESSVDAVRAQNRAIEEAGSQGFTLEKLEGMLERPDDSSTPLISITTRDVCVFEYRASRVGLRALLQETMRGNSQAPCEGLFTTEQPSSGGRAAELGRLTAYMVGAFGLIWLLWRVTRADR